MTKISSNASGEIGHASIRGNAPRTQRSLYSDVRLTLGVYTHIGVHDQTAAIASVPAPPSPQSNHEQLPKALRATGTDDVGINGAERHQQKVPTVVPRGAQNGAIRPASQALRIASDCTEGDEKEGDRSRVESEENPEKIRMNRTDTHQVASVCTSSSGAKEKISPRGLEPLTFGSGVLPPLPQSRILTL
jgi:hypothetical protein